jgi:DNA primase catalytic subunit
MAVNPTTQEQASQLLFELYSKCIGKDLNNQPNTNEYPGDRKLFFEISCIRKSGKTERYLNFDADGLSRFIKTHTDIQRLDVGPVYEVYAGDKHMACNQKELVILYSPWRFDCDLDTLDPLDRPCCGTQKQCCATCWKDKAIPLIIECNRLSQRFYGCDAEIFFSGSKGFHAWIPLDLMASITDQETRRQQLEQYHKELCARLDYNSVLDKNCTITPNHLIRMPWSIHMKTGSRVTKLDLSNLDYYHVMKQASESFVSH